jgi:autotransporter-associated beta strand protein
MNITRILATTALLTTAATTTLMADALQWGAGGSSKNWSDGNNWNNHATFQAPYGSPPGASDVVDFEDAFYTTGYTNVQGAVNNIVDTNSSIGAVNYYATNNHFYTTLIPAGVSLTLGGLGSGALAALAVGDVPTSTSPTWANPGNFTTYSNYSTITGAGALNVANSSMLISVGWINRATLDLAGLNQFNANVSQVLVGASPDNPYSVSSAGPAGWLLLARTNTLTTAPNLSGPGVLLGFSTNAANGGSGVVALGGANAFNTDGLTIGGRRSNQSGAPTKLLFGDSYVNTSPLANFTLRGSAGGSTPIKLFSVGDESANCDGYATTYPGTSSTSVGTADFSGGTVDIQADTIIVGRNAILPIVQGGSGTGTLIVEHGTVTATNVFVAQRSGTNGSSAFGTLTLKGDAVMNVISNFTLGFRTNLLTPGGATGTLNVNDSAVLNVAGNFITGYTNNSTISQTINIGGGQINVAGVITNYPGSRPPVLTNAGGTINGNGSTLNLFSLSGFGTLSNISTTTVSNALALGISNATAAGAARVPGTLVVGGNLALNSSAITMQFKLGSITNAGGPFNDFLVVSNNLNVNSNKIDLLFVGQPVIGGAYDLINYGGALSNLGGNLAAAFTNVYVNTTRGYSFNLDQSLTNHVRLIVGGTPSATLTWSGGGNGYWDLTNSMNWNTNAAQFYSYDNVVFDDTAPQTVVAIPGTVVMGGMTFNNNSKTYTLWDTPPTSTGSKFNGTLSGFGGITKNGTGTVILALNDSKHDFVGPININNGVMQDQSPGGGGPPVQLFGSTNNVITIASGASLDLYGYNVGANIGANGVFIGIGYPLVFSGSGHGGIGAIANTTIAPSSTNSSILYTPNATMVGNASIGATTAGFNVTVKGTSPGAKLDLGGNANTLSTVGSGNVILSTFVATNDGNIQVNGPSLSLVDVQLGGAGTLNVGSKILGLGTLNGSGWTSTYGISKAISIGGTIAAVGSSPATAGAGGVTIPVSSPITLTGNTLITNNQAINLSGVVAGGYGITKQGTANLTINNSDTYTGQTIVNAGNLVLGAAGSLANSPLVRIDAGAGIDVTAQPGSYTIPSGQTVQVDGSLAGNLTVPSGATISGAGSCAFMTSSTVAVNGGSVVPGKLDLPRTLAFANLSLNNASLTYELDTPTTAGANVNDLVAAINLSFSGTNTIKIVPIGPLTSGGQYTLFTYNTNTTGVLPSSITNNLVLTSDTSYTLTLLDPTNAPGTIQIQVAGAGGVNKVWQGGVAAAPTAWDINTTSNWLAGIAPANFYNLDSVQFDDTGLTNVVDLAGSVRPSTVTFANNTQPYTLQGSGSLRADTMTNSGTAGVTIANAANNTLTGAGLFLANGTVTFNQPSNAIFAAILNGTGPGELHKVGMNQLTLVGDSGATFSGPIAVNQGTLQAGSSNSFGAGRVTVASSATADLNGQVVVSNTFALTGSGVGGLGALNNTGAQQTNAVQGILLQGDTTLGAVSRWDLVPGGTNAFQGNGFNLAKVGAGAVFLGPKQDTSVSNIDIQAGELAFAWPGTDLGTTGVITVESNAMLAFAYDIAAGTKPTTVMAGGQIGAEYLNSFGRSNSYAGDITFSSTGLVNIANSSAGLILSGGLHGPSGLVNAGRGSLTLAGSNSYAGDLTFNLGNGTIANSNAIPGNTSVTLNCLGAPGIDNVGLNLVNDIATPANAPLNMVSYRSPLGNITPSLSGNGTWNGPINAIAVQTDNSQNCVANFNGGSTKLVLNGAITQTGAAQMSLNFNGAMPGSIALNQPLVWSGLITMVDNYSSTNLGDDAYVINTLELNAAGNSFTNFVLDRGRIRIGVNNAYPSGCSLGTAAGGSSQPNIWDYRALIDLNGHSQTFSNCPAFGQGFASWIGNDSTNSDATVIYDSSSRLTNTWGSWICDNLNSNLSVTNRTRLTVLSGGLRLVNNNAVSKFYTNVNQTASGPTNNVYTGNTLVSGGILQVDTSLGATAVTVSGSGILAGTGPFSSAGSVTINSGGTLSPGGNAALASAIGIMTNNGTLTLNPGSTTYLEVNLTTKTNDTIRGLATVVFNGGTLLVTNLGAQVITNGSAFKFFFATNYTLNAVSVMPPVPALGLAWDTSQLAISGTLRVMPVNTAPPTLAATSSGSSLTLSWPQDHAGWRLQVQTNSSAVGIGTNWFTVPGSTNAVSVTVPVVLDNPCVFYRLVYP